MNFKFKNIFEIFMKYKTNKEQAKQLKHISKKSIQLKNFQSPLIMLALKHKIILSILRICE